MWQALTPSICRPRIVRSCAFSLVELVLVIVIIGILAAIAVPRFTRGSTAAAEAALKADLRQLRTALTSFAVEHNNTFPGPLGQDVADQLTRYSNLAGDTADTRSTAYRFGPYLHAIPPCPVGENAGKATASAILISTDSPPTPVPASGEGWVYNATTGEILPNTNMKAESGVKFIEAEATAEALPLPGP